MATSFVGGPLALFVAACAIVPSIAFGAPPYVSLFDGDKLHTIELVFRSEDDVLWLADREHPWMRADVEIDGEKLAGIGVRGKSGGRIDAKSPRGSLRLGFGKINKGRRFRGLKHLVLNNAFYDPSLMREKLAYDLFRAAGCPASRAAHAEVYFTVRGKRELIGLYTMVEHVGDVFLDERFGGHRGNLFEITGNGDFFSRDRAAFAERTAKLHTNEKRPDRKRLDEMLAAIGGDGGDAVEEWIDIEGFLRCLAANTALVNLDSYAGTGHNFYLYDDPARGKFVFIPWDHDQAFALLYDEPSEAMIRWDIFAPHIGGKILIERVLADPRHRTRYAEILRGLVAGPYSPVHMSRRIRAIDRIIGGAVARDPHKPFSTELYRASLVEDVREEPRRFFGAAFGLDPFVRARARSILAQLAGFEPGEQITRGTSRR